MIKKESALIVLYDNYTVHTNVKRDAHLPNFQVSFIEMISTSSFKMGLKLDPLKGKRQVQKVIKVEVVINGG